MKSGWIILVSTLLGAFVGFSLCYMFFDQPIRVLQEESSNLAIENANLNLHFSEMEDLFLMSVAEISSDISEAQSLITNLNLSLDEVENSIIDLEIDLENDLSILEYKLQSLESGFDDLKIALDEIIEREWHMIEELSGNIDAATGLLHLEGRRVRLVWSMWGMSPESWIEFRIYFSNGTLLHSVGSSGIYGSYTAELILEEPVDFRLYVETYQINLWKIQIWNYY